MFRNFKYLARHDVDAPVNQLLFYLVNGQCRTDCACVPTDSRSPEDHCCLFINENLPPGSPVGNANDLPLIAGFGAVTFEFAPNKNELGALFSFSETTGTITTAVTIDKEAISVEDDCIGSTVRGAVFAQTLDDLVSSFKI